MRAFLAAAILFPLSALASTVVGISIENLAAKSRTIVRGTILESVSRWDVTQTRIETWSRVRVVENVKGKTPRVISVVQPGGTVGSKRDSVSGAAQFSRGDEVVLFLERYGAAFTLTALTASKVQIVTTADGERRAVRDLAGLSIAAPNATALQRPSERDADLGPADAFLHALRASAARPQ